MISAHVFYRKQRLVTDYEFKYLNNLRSWFGSDFDILSQVSFGALLAIDTTGMDQEESNVAQKIQRMIVDFVVVSKSTDEVVCIIELDDATHGREERQQRDRRLDAVCLAIKLPIFHVTQLQQKPDILTIVGWRTRSAADFNLMSHALKTSFYDQLQTYNDDFDDTLTTMLEGQVFKRKKCLCTNYELKYLNNLRSWFGSDCYILPQVSFSALMSYNIDAESKLSKADKLKVAQKIHSLAVDFVVVSKSTENVVCLIELDKPTSYQLDEDQRRQHRLDALCSSLQLPIFHVTKLQYKPDVMSLVVRKSVGKQVKNQITNSSFNYKNAYSGQKKQWSSTSWSKSKEAGTSTAKYGKRTYNSAYGSRWQSNSTYGDKSQGASAAGSSYGKRNNKSTYGQKKQWRSTDGEQGKGTSTARYSKRTYNKSYAQSKTSASATNSNFSQRKKRSLDETWNAPHMWYGNENLERNDPF